MQYERGGKGPKTLKISSLQLQLEAPHNRFIWKG
jgi:hypothetical protein